MQTRRAPTLSPRIAIGSHRHQRNQRKVGTVPLFRRFSGFVGGSFFRSLRQICIFYGPTQRQLTGRAIF